ncbi:Cof-type HAD-IIB family hydrolase [Lachnospiraceae bacterium OttesenSCG-928-E19]|nr:Cof-type HAD-IIB family hydrolase [Lachnospiraceae bacterium OttesenSCG-928-E19]
MIGLDLDGTLLNEEKLLSEKTKSTLLKAMNQGVIVVIATGRPLIGVPDFLRKLPGIRYVLTANGARIIDQVEEKVLIEKLLKQSDAQKVLEIFAECDTLMEVFHEGKGYRSVVNDLPRFFENPHIVEYMERTRSPSEDMIGIVNEFPEGLDKVRATFARLDEREAVAQRIEKETDLTITSAVRNDLEITAENVNKGVGMLALGEMLGISRQEIMACGDGMNDYEMIKQVGFGVAMGNAVEPVKQVANYITETNDDEGVAKAIEAFVLD